MTSKTSRDRLHIIGAGCAGLSLYHYLHHYPDVPDITFHGHISPAVTTPHFWGFWRMNWLQEAAEHAQCKWHSWQFATNEQLITHHSPSHPYCALSSTDWLAHCHASEISVCSDMPSSSDRALIFDSRPPRLPHRPMLQHFIGQRIRLASAGFSPDKAILMDFRCSQEQGIHFIYLLPFSKTEALVESTLFSHALVDDDFYRQAITDYMTDIIGQTRFEICSEERGVIPMCITHPNDSAYYAIGSNGGCIRPSSGYAFSFIQKQMQQLAGQLASSSQTNTPPKMTMPHRAIDMWLDRVFLSVIAHHPDHAPQLFMAMARALDGNGFARFMSGCAQLSDYRKLIQAMPKGLFIRHALRTIIKDEDKYV